MVFLRYQVVEPDVGAGPDASEQAQTEQDQPDVTFTFYDTLRNKKVNISEWMAGAQGEGDKAAGEETAETPAVEQGKELVAEQEQRAAQGRETQQDGTVYVLQAGSFKDYSSADQVKAELALLGIFAEIQRVMLNEKDVRHRVRLGPFKSAAEMRNISRTLKDNNLDFLVLELREGQGISASSADKSLQ